MEFNAKECLKNFNNIVIVGGSTPKYTNDMYNKTKEIVKYTAFIPNGTDISQLCDELKNLPQITLDQMYKSVNFFVIIAVQDPGWIKNLSNKLNGSGLKYDHISNYTFFIDFSILCDLGYKHYIDYLGNDISFEGVYPRNKLLLEKTNRSFAKKCVNNEIRLGKINVDQRLKLAVLGYNGCISIGNNTSFSEAIISVITNGKVTIGDDSMFSYTISVFQPDMHLIFDLNTEKRINANKNITIGNHVWIGKSVQLLGGCSIPDNCIVGARSVTSRKFTEKNCIIAGNPAKVIRKDIIWAEDAQQYDYQTYEECEDQRALKYLDE